MLISVSFNLFLTDGREIFRLGFLKITAEGLSLAFYGPASDVPGAWLIDHDADDDAEPAHGRPGKSLGFMNRLHVPVHEVSMMMSIAARFIPILIEETDKIMKAQMARGADFETGNLMQRAKSMIPLLVPLFVSAFRRANRSCDGNGSQMLQGRCGKNEDEASAPMRRGTGRLMPYLLSIWSLLSRSALLCRTMPGEE